MVSVKPQNVWIGDPLELFFKNVIQLIQIQIQSSNQTSTFKIITKPTKKESQWETATIPPWDSHVATEHTFDYRTKLRGDACLSHGKRNPCLKASLLIINNVYSTTDI